jgi:putative ABC transport system permease protein
MRRAALMVKLSLRNVFRNRRHSLYALATIMIGTAGLLVFMGFNKGTMDEYRENTIRARWGHGQVYVRGYRDAGLAELWHKWIENPATVTARLRMLSDVRDVFPRVTISAILSAGDKTVAGLGEGIDGVAEARFFTRMNYVEGGDFGERPAGIVLGQGLARGLGARVGDEVQLMSRGKRGEPRSFRATVTGIFHTGSQEFDNRAFRIPLARAQELLGTQRVETVSVALTGVDAWPAFAREVKSALPDLEAVPFDELDKVYYKHAVDWLDAQFAFIQGIILFMVFFGAFNAVSMTVIERTAEIGTLRANGESRFEIALGQLMEAATLGILGGCLGVLGAWLLSIGPLRDGISMPPAPGLTRGLRITIGLEFWGILKVLQLALATSVAGSLLPSWRSTHIPITEALRHV